MSIKLVECPRDAMQGLQGFVPTELKANYINKLLRVGFDTVDFGSFVSPKAIPQMRDTASVLGVLDLDNTKSKLLAIVANKRGGEEASSFPEIHYLGFPFSVSPTFLKRNINASVEESFQRMKDVASIANKGNKKIVVYISMAFGNPYNDEWDIELVVRWLNRMVEEGVGIISLADTTGVGSPGIIGRVYNACASEVDNVELGIHLHTTATNWKEKIGKAYSNGCHRFDGVLNGLGGCPMAGEGLVGNVSTVNLIEFFEQKGEVLDIDKVSLNEAVQASMLIHD